MTKNYTQLSLVQRYQIEAFLKAGKKQKFIAEQIGVHPSTISRELRRNTATRGRYAGLYDSQRAQQKAEKRHHTKPKHVRFDDSMKEYAAEMLQDKKWSPELISKRGTETGECPVSHECLYQWIWESKHGNRQRGKRFKRLYVHLKHGHRRRKRGNRRETRGIIPGRTSITQRPKIVNRRSRLGDIEVDLMIGKDHKSALLVMTDRTTLQTRLKKLAGKQAMDVKRAMIQTLKKAPYPIKTLTFDNDMAFSKHLEIGRALGAATYFTRPYTSQDKGTVENRIGVIRRFYPKKTDIRQVSDKEINHVENLLNNRPVRKFNYQSPNQKLLEKLH